MWAPDRPRYLRDPRGGRGDYTSIRSRAIYTEREAEAVCDEWLARFASHAANQTAKRDLTMRRAAQHGIRVLLRHEGPSDSTPVKARIAQALGCDIRTIERGAADMQDLQRRRGYRSSTTWSVTGDTPDPISRTPLSPTAIREQVTIKLIGERQQSTATDREIAAELISDAWIDLMGAIQVYIPEEK